MVYITELPQGVLLKKIKIFLENYKFYYKNIVLYPHIGVLTIFERQQNSPSKRKMQTFLSAFSFGVLFKFYYETYFIGATYAGLIIE